MDRVIDELSNVVEAENDFLYLPELRTQIEKFVKGHNLLSIFQDYNATFQPFDTTFVVPFINFNIMGTQLQMSNVSGHRVEDGCSTSNIISVAAEEADKVDTVLYKQRVLIKHYPLDTNNELIRHRSSEANNILSQISSRKQQKTG